MKIILEKILILCLALALLLGTVPGAAAYEIREPYQKDLSGFMKNDAYRAYVEMMLDHHVRTNVDVRNALEGGFSAVFLFDGCSDNLDDPELADLSYYRVSGVCIVLRMTERGEIRMVYFNDNCSTIPDRPLEIGAWALPEVGEVGPATIFDGTYQLYSVRHKGEYEALHMRTDYWDMTLDAVYLTEDGFVTSRANEINVHTRTSNHTSGRGMWSAGCPLVGDGDPWQFQWLVLATYYPNYETFEVDNFVGTITIDRMNLRQELYTLYENPDAVDTFLANSQAVQPVAYLEQCTDEIVLEEPAARYAGMETELMSLPCSNATDARSQLVAEIPKGERLKVLGSTRNSADNVWYQVEWENQRGYVFAGHTNMPGWLERVFGTRFE